MGRPYLFMQSWIQCFSWISQCFDYCIFLNFSCTYFSFFYNQYSYNRTKMCSQSTSEQRQCFMILCNVLMIVLLTFPLKAFDEWKLILHVTLRRFNWKAVSMAAQSRSQSNVPCPVCQGLTWCICGYVV